MSVGWPPCCTQAATVCGWLPLAPCRSCAAIQVWQLHAAHAAQSARLRIRVDGFEVKGHACWLLCGAAHAVLRHDHWDSTVLCMRCFGPATGIQLQPCIPFGCRAVGNVPPFGHRRPLPTIVDSSVTRYQTCYAGGGSEDAEIFLTVAELLLATGGPVADISAADSTSASSCSLAGSGDASGSELAFAAAEVAAADGAADLRLAAAAAAAAALPLPWRPGQEEVTLHGIIAHRCAGGVWRCGGACLCPPCSHLRLPFSLHTCLPVSSSGLSALAMAQAQDCTPAAVCQPGAARARGAGG